MKEMMLGCCVLLWGAMGVWASRTPTEMLNFAKTRLAWYYQESTPPDHLDPEDKDSVAEFVEFERWNAQPKTLRFVFDDSGRSTNAFPFAENCAAFDLFLSTLGTNDCQRAVALDSQHPSWEDPVHERNAYRGLFLLIGDISYTNACPHLQALALNPKGIMRTEAIDLAIKLGPTNDAMTDFVETVVTNLQFFSRTERAMAGGRYCQKLMDVDSNEIQKLAVRRRAAERFYRSARNVFFDPPRLDMLCMCSIEGYSTSSNRLDFALGVLCKDDCSIKGRRYFTAVTNQLISSGQPLRQLNLGEAGE